jgi:hypothetical protein
MYKLAYEKNLLKKHAFFRSFPCHLLKIGNEFSIFVALPNIFAVIHYHLNLSHLYYFLVTNEYHLEIDPSAPTPIWNVENFSLTVRFNVS